MATSTNMSRPPTWIDGCTTPRPQRRAAQRGMSLIELMVGLVIALVLSLAMLKMLLYAEGERRTLSAGNDAQQAGTIGSYAVERYLRMGGAGIDQIDRARGCKLKAGHSDGKTMVPLPSGLAAPFDPLAGSDLPVAPVLIANGGVPDND